MPRRKGPERFKKYLVDAAALVAALTLLNACSNSVHTGEPGACLPVTATGVDGNTQAIRLVNSPEIQGIRILNSPKEQGTVIGVRELNGVTLEVADTGSPLTFAEGALAAPGFADTAALQNTMLSAITANGARHLVEVVAVEREGDVDRIALELDGVRVCDIGDDGVFVEGRWDETGAHIDEPGAVTYACMSGVIAKCVAWGYAPWVAGQSVHQTCTRMARADYCGDGEAWTLEGTTIDVYDALGIHSATASEAFSFEAAWGPEGAVCANGTRYDVVDAEGKPVEPSCLASLPRCGSLSEAQVQGAVLANGSAPTRIAVCE